MEPYHPLRRFARQVRRALKWVWDLPNVKFIFFVLFAVLFAIVPREYYASRSFLLFIVIIVPFIIYVAVLGSTVESDTEEWVSGHRRTLRHDDDEKGDNDA